MSSNPSCMSAAEKNFDHFAWPEQIDYIQVDHTSRCNLLCSQCSRVHNGAVNPILPQQELEVEDYKRIFVELPKVQEVFFCGNYGDASVSTTFLPSLEYLRSINIPCLKLSTNGSARDISWWKSLAQVLHKPKDLVAFSIDGLESTNSIYRVNSSWKKIMENAAAFIEAGGRARWDFIVFSHNEHQVEEARGLALKMGFSAFSVKKTNRILKFADSPVAVPKEAKYIGDAVQKISEVSLEHGSWEKYLETTEVNCRYRRERIGVFLDFQARLWPCCWMAAPLFQYDEVEQKPYILNLLDRFGYEFNSLRKFSVNEVLNHPWFSRELVKSWKDVKQKSPTCARYCGSGLSYSSESKENREIQKLLD